MVSRFGELFVHCCSLVRPILGSRANGRINAIGVDVPANKPFFVRFRVLRRLIGADDIVGVPVSRRSTFVLTRGPCDCLHAARFGLFRSSCPILCPCLFLLFSIPLFFYTLTTYHVTTHLRPVLTLCYLLVPLTTFCFEREREWAQARMKG